MSAQYAPHSAPRRRSPWLTVTGLNLAALISVSVPALLILRSSGLAPELGFNLFTAIAGLLVVGLAACGGAACALGRRGGVTSATLLLPLAASALVAAFALLASVVF